MLLRVKFAHGGDDEKQSLLRDVRFLYREALAANFLLKRLGQPCRCHWLFMALDHLLVLLAECLAFIDQSPDFQKLIPFEGADSGRIGLLV